MLEGKAYWCRIKGDGLVYDGPCLVTAIVFWPDAASDYVDVYDGRDTTTGIKFCRVESVTSNTLVLSFSPPVAFGRGIYIDGIDAAVEATVVYIPCQ